MTRILLPLMTLLALTFAPLAGHSAELKLEIEPGDVLDRIDDLWRGDSSEGVMTMAIVTDRFSRTLKMQMWTKGKEQTLVRILEPKKEKGVSTLRNGNEMWNYLPKVKRTVKLNSSMMSKSWLGSDFTYDDFIKESRMRDDYSYEITFFGESGGSNQIELTCVPHEDSAVVWGKVVLHVLAQDLMPTRIEYFDEDMELARVMEFSDVRMFGSRKLPGRMVVSRPDKPGQSTTIDYVDLAFDIDVPDSTFSLRNLKG